MNSSHHSNNFSLGLPLGLLIYTSQLSLLISTWLSQTQQVQNQRYNLSFLPKNLVLVHCPWGPFTQIWVSFIPDHFRAIFHYLWLGTKPLASYLSDTCTLILTSTSFPCPSHYHWVEVQLWSCPTLFPNLSSTMWEGPHGCSCTHTDLKPFSGTPCVSRWPALDLRVSPQLCVFQPHELPLGHIMILLALAITDILVPPVRSSLLPFSDSLHLTLFINQLGVS